MLPVSSSGHLALLPELLRWPYARADPEVRKHFEVALHAGAAAAMAIVMRGEVAELARGLDARRLALLAASVAPPAVAGLAFGGPIERCLGRPRQLAAAQLCAGLALAASDRRPATRSHASADACDHLAIGLAQAVALVPGVSRGGVVLTVARLRGFRRPAASRLSREVALPAIFAAGGRMAMGLVRKPPTRELARAFAAGAAAAFAAALAASPLLAAADLGRSYTAIGVYRVSVGALALSRSRGAGGAPSPLHLSAAGRRDGA